MACPCEPEEANGEDYSADDHRGKTALGDDFARSACVLPSEDGKGVRYDGDEPDDDADEEGDEGQGGEARSPMTVLDKGDWEAFEEEEEHAVEKTLVESYEDEDGFRTEEDYKSQLAA